MDTYEKQQKVIDKKKKKKKIKIKYISTLIPSMKIHLAPSSIVTKFLFSHSFIASGI